jgi:hypothetical protein
MLSATTLCVILKKSLPKKLFSGLYTPYLSGERLWLPDKMAKRHGMSGATVLWVDKSH